MNSDIVKQSLIDSFEVLKDFWDKKKEAIIYCIVETEAYDGEIAMSMWHYIIQNNLRELSTNEGTKELFINVLRRFCDRYGNQYRNYSGRNDLWVMLEHISLHIIQNRELIKNLFEKSFNAGYNSGYVYHEEVSALIASIFLQGNLSIIEMVIQALANNKHLANISIGTIIRDTCKYIEEIEPDSDIGEKYIITSEIKEVLLNSLNFISNREERADCMVTILAL